MKKLTLQATCITCKQVFELVVNANDMLKYKAGCTVQTAFPYLSADERELLVTRMCGTCFDKLFE